MISDPRFVALNREAELAKRVTCSGLSAIRRATPARSGIYYDAFFGISIGLERLAKLVWLIDQCITRRGSFPKDTDLRSLGHNILALLDKAKAIRSNRICSQGAQNEWKYATLSCDAVTISVIKCLSDFAQATRYFNIDFMVGGKATQMGDPIKVWHNMVGAAVLATSEFAAKQSRWHALATARAQILSPAIVIATSADGRALDDVADLLLGEHEAAEINKQVQWKVLGIVRFLCLLLIDLSDVANAEGHNFIPYLREHFGFFCEDDAIIRRYKTWPPRGVT
jgi:hypothetical protein